MGNGKRSRPQRRGGFLSAKHGPGTNPCRNVLGAWSIGRFISPKSIGSLIGSIAHPIAHKNLLQRPGANTMLTGTAFSGRTHHPVTADFSHKFFTITTNFIHDVLYLCSCLFNVMMSFCVVFVTLADRCHVRERFDHTQRTVAKRRFKISSAG